jgi:hypothetical protein
VDGLFPAVLFNLRARAVQQAEQDSVGRTFVTFQAARISRGKQVGLLKNSGIFGGQRVAVVDAGHRLGKNFGR